MGCGRASVTAEEDSSRRCDEMGMGEGEDEGRFIDALLALCFFSFNNLPSPFLTQHPFVFHRRHCSNWRKGRRGRGEEGNREYAYGNMDEYEY
jgi:hypothetical protein